MSKQDDAKAIMPKYLSMIESDLMKVTRYLKDAVKVAIVLKDDKLAETLAIYYVAAEELTNDFKTSADPHITSSRKDK